MKDLTVLIPLRLASKRLKGKPLLKIGDKPLFVHIYENIFPEIRSVFITTADKKIAEECKNRRIPFILTSSKPRNGSERVAEAVSNRKIKSDIIIDLQGDEIDADAELIRGAVSALVDKKANVSTAVAPLKMAETKDKDTVKVILDQNNRCIFFTRAPVPYFRNKSKLSPSVYRHIGIYCYKRETLFRYRKLKPTYLEECESLEQMRLIENGIEIYGFITQREYRKIDNINELRNIRGKQI